MLTPARYLTWCLIAFLGLTGAAVVLAVSVDPYYLFNARRIDGFNALKPRVYEQVEIAKTVQLERSKANTLILGNSRIEIGIDPLSKVFPGAAEPVFNGAIAGRTMFTALRVLQDAIAVHPPKTIIVGLDFPDYLRAEQMTSSDPPPSSLDRRMLVDRSGAPNPDRVRQRSLDTLTATLTIGALVDSFDTILDQDPDYSVTMTPEGFNPLHEYRLEVKTLGEYLLFSQKDASYRAEYAGYRPAAFKDVETNREFRALTAILETAARSRIHVELIIYPYHVHYLELIHQSGLWETFRAWQRAVAALVTERRQSGLDVKLWDFSGYNEISEEKIPSPGDRRTQMRWYWEAGHFKSALGDKMLSNLYGRASDFGVEIDSGSLADHFAQVDEKRAAFVAN